jgi:RHS repeat-associated protein
VPNYSYNASNDLTSNSNGSYTYDADGNTLTDASGKSYTWDFENRLVQAIVPGTNAGTTTFKYDPFGRRIQKSGPLGTTNYLYDGMSLIEETDTNGVVVARYSQSQGIDAPLAMSRSRATSFYNADGLGSATSLANGAGALTQTYTYDSFGKPTASSGSLTNPFEYTGREFDSETGLYYYRARYYDPSIGRFTSEDPFGFKGSGVNFYDYVQNNATNSTDPLGLCKNKLRPDQCDKIRILLNREAAHGTARASQMSAIGFGDNTLDPFNSSVAGQAYVDTALGTVKLDWFADISMVPTSAGKDVAYFLGKNIWTDIRLIWGAPITNPVPYQDPVEIHTAFLAEDGTPYRDLFPPDWMAQNCPGH